MEDVPAAKDGEEHNTTDNNIVVTKAIK